MTEAMSATVWASASSHRSRHRLAQAVPDLGPEHGVWPEGGWPRGSYYQIPAKYAAVVGRIKGLRVLRGEPSGGRIFKRWTSAELGTPERGEGTGRR